MTLLSEAQGDGVLRELARFALAGAQAGNPPLVLLLSGAWLALESPQLMGGFLGYLDALNGPEAIEQHHRDVREVMARLAQVVDRAGVGA